MRAQPKNKNKTEHRKQKQKIILYICQSDSLQYIINFIFFFFIFSHPYIQYIYFLHLLWHISNNKYGRTKEKYCNNIVNNLQFDMTNLI